MTKTAQQVDQQADKAASETPRPGDAIRLTGSYWGANVGELAVIDSAYFGATLDADNGPIVMGCFHVSAFRDGGRVQLGTAIELSMTEGQRTDDGEVVSCSGGPCPFIPVADLTYAGVQEITFWRWKDRPRADGGIEYQRTVPLWAWEGER